MTSTPCSGDGKRFRCATARPISVAPQPRRFEARVVDWLQRGQACVAPKPRADVRRRRGRSDDAFPGALHGADVRRRVQRPLVDAAVPRFAARDAGPPAPAFSSRAGATPKPHPSADDCAEPDVKSGRAHGPLTSIRYASGAPDQVEPPDREKSRWSDAWRIVSPLRPMQPERRMSWRTRATVVSAPATRQSCSRATAMGHHDPWRTRAFPQAESAACEGDGRSPPCDGEPRRLQTWNAPSSAGSRPNSPPSRRPRSRLSGWREPSPMPSPPRDGVKSTLTSASP